jgi:hypothetical protein
LTTKSNTLVRRIAPTKEWLTTLDDFRNWLTWACGPRNAMKISASE